MAREHDKDIIPAETILQNLAKRPNVRATLILSRADGSIIKATGFVASSTEESPRHSRTYSTTGAAARDNTTGRDEEVLRGKTPESQTANSTPSPAQVLAGSIHTFVVSAAALAESLGKINTLGDVSTGRIDTVKDRQDKEESSPSDMAQAEDDVQLLRLRLKKQEVIIFPDTKYLCCVVQDLEKGAR